jgi:hypothetical protein
MLSNTHPASDNLLTVDSPDFSYPDNAMVDMEASGFLTAACRFTRPELIHSLKVISDNRQNPPIRMKPKAVEDLFNPHMATIQQYMERLLELRSSLTHTQPGKQ